jgi:hypothetical protein
VARARNAREAAGSPCSALDPECQRHGPGGYWERNGPAVRRSGAADEARPWRRSSPAAPLHP